MGVLRHFERCYDYRFRIGSGGLCPLGLIHACYVMLSYVTLLHVMFCYVMLCYISEPKKSFKLLILLEIAPCSLI